ncbi:hypothetical protein VV01_13715 [Luteipulveratus halotolerans]|uniref:Plastocyanin-like domain-containing protein n=2 Tax=Luteipulveratus halotolerans TaxID=1631356 RepID=A0A0L6CJL3_9MICO|nr:hypothetical protein VV01_13715 [Luteipulveratus halotolerans]
MPIVYDGDGDHDPDGLMFALQAHRPLLEWVRDRWEDDDERLPRLHRRRQLAQVVVDNLARLELMIERLRSGDDDDLRLLTDLLRREQVPEYDEPEDRLSHGPRRRSSNAGAVRTNVHRTLEELRLALTELSDTDGLPQWRDLTHPPLEPEADAEDEVDEESDDGEGTDDEDLPLRVVGLSRGQRAAWRASWQEQIRILDDAIATCFERMESDPERRFDAAALAEASGMPERRVRRLVLNDHRRGVSGRGELTPAYDRFNPMRPVPVVAPLVLRTHVGERVTVEVENQIRGRRLGFHLQGDGLAGPGGKGVRHGDGAHVGGNPDTTLAYGERATFTYAARHEGAWPINDLADVRGRQDGSNVHGLFGALLVEPEGSHWHDPETGEDLTETSYCGLQHVDVIMPDERPGTPEHADFVDFNLDDVPRSHREFTVFMHDEPEVHSALHLGSEHTVMPISYRAEPMGNRLPHRMRRLAERTSAEPPDDQQSVDRSAVKWELGPDLDEVFWTARTPEGDWLERVAGEEQHHSSWLFGDPVTPILRAYRGDPCRIRLIHGGVKETHVYHLHVHQWRAVAADTAPPGTWGLDASGALRRRGSQLIDSITIGPQTAFTIEPLYGSGSRQEALGDIIWHCHLYPHFHHGMWGLWRSFDRLVDGTRALPDGTPCRALVPLPGRTPPAPDREHPGFPWFIDAVHPMKSPPPPAAVADQVDGRRRLLGMPPASDRERAAMHPACRDGEQPGALFVDLDGDAAAWNERCGLPRPRVLSYDIEVLTSRIDYNIDGWHDPNGHRYRLLAAQIREVDDQGRETVVEEEWFDLTREGNPEPVFPRANHGDIVELRLHNALGSFPADQYDLAQLPVECGLHVHLVKFDVLASDGSSTGFNYLSGASCREVVGPDRPGELRTVSRHRWVVDEEFGPCFFHDHLLANYRQKRGLWSALQVQPYGAQWHTSDQTRTAWHEPQAVIVPPAETGLPAYREACLGVGDFIPLLDRGGRTLNPPGELGGDDDPGSMGVGYRSAPLTFRGDDPSRWFSTSARSDISFHGTRGDPDTPVLQGYPDERLRIRLVQGSHEEQHSFGIHGMRWRRDWHQPRSRLVNQQTIGISEAFTVDIDPVDAGRYGPGDHLWRLGDIDDTWVGCWGYVRINQPRTESYAALPPLPRPGESAAEADERMRSARATPPRPQRIADDEYDESVRTYVVVARRTEHLHTGRHLTDPWGLTYLLAEMDPQEYAEARREGEWRPSVVQPSEGPLVLRVHRGEWIRLFLVNEVLRDDDAEAVRLPRFGVEPNPPRLPLEHLDDLGQPDRRTVTPRVSIHAALLQYDVRTHDGAHVGRNVDGTVSPLRTQSAHEHEPEDEGAGRVVLGDRHHARENWRELWWYADEQLAPASHADGPGQVCLLHDVADVRNHRHHGLIGAIVVEPGDVRPYRRRSRARRPDGYAGVAAEMRDRRGAVVAHEAVVLMQDGLRLSVDGHPELPVPDNDPGGDPEDRGQKGLNHRTALMHRGRPPHGALAGPPLATVEQGVPLWLRVVGAGDKPRQHTLTVHGLAWPVAPWVPGSAWVGSLSGIAGGTTEDVVALVEHPGDHALRSGAFRWATETGVWTMVRVEPHG